MKKEDGSVCYICRATEAQGTALHVHHIVHRSRSGTNAKKNLITLCIPHHQAQHPDFIIGRYGGEPPGVDFDDEDEMGDPLEEVEESAFVVDIPDEAPVAEASTVTEHVPMGLEWQAGAPQLSTDLPAVETVDASPGRVIPPACRDDQGALSSRTLPRHSSADNNSLVFAKICFVVGGLLMLIAASLWLSRYS